jgi:hypothetical protein
MASRLIDALVKARREAGLDALILFSEVGTELYETLGFKALPAPRRSWPAGWSAGAEAERAEREALSVLLEERRRLRADRVDLLVTEWLADWHLERARFYARVLRRPEPRHVGARANGCVAIWCADFKSDALRLLDLSGPPHADPAPVLAAAAREAKELGLERVELWDDGQSALLGPPGTEFRDDDLPMGQSFSPRGELFLGAFSRACWA